MNWRAAVVVTLRATLLAAMCLVLFCAWMRPVNVASWLLLAALCT